MKTRIAAIAIAIGVSSILAACGASGSGDSASSAATNPTGGATAGSSKTTPGVWQGTLISPTTGSASLVGLTDASGHSVWMSTDGRVWAGQMPATGTQFDGNMTGYMYPGSRFADGSNYGAWSMMARYADNAWSGQLNGSGDRAEFRVAMHPAYDRPASLALLAGTYTRTTSIGYTLTLSFTQSGQMTGSDSRGCVFSGNVTVPDAAHDLYQVAATVSSCGMLDGVYSGHGTLVDATTMQDWVSRMGCFQYGPSGWSGGMMGAGMMTGGGMGNWWPLQGTNTVPSGTGNLFMFAMSSGQHAIMDALAR
jgi:hypothetical protein